MNEGKIGHASITFQYKRTSEYAAKVPRLQAGERFDYFGLKVAFDKLRWINEMKNVVLVTLTGH
ncbi:MAG: hypothetical protein Q7K40_05795 [bacterium]|nr:hypothetical protein [bacterium]